MAYTAALQAALAVLTSHDLKVRGTSNHYMTFYALQKVNDTLRESGRRFDGLRLARHQAIYEPEDDEDMPDLLKRAMDALRVGLPACREEIITVRPSLAGRLAPPGF